MLFAIIALILAFIVTILAIRGTVFLLKYTAAWMTDRRPEVFPRPTRCPRCTQSIGRFERLRSFREVVLGGWTCPGCGSEFDQLDNALVARAWNAHLRDAKNRLRLEDQLEAAHDTRSPVEKLLDD
ncbi:MAG TPA: hypothetical protein VJV05_15525 [Pyrinomonadaceae bacterium]|nr:hypothetical protein [Pyrinomonadaceae bacterium]